MRIENNRPLIPEEKVFISNIQNIISSGIITNNGKFVQSLEKKLAENYFEDKYVSVHCNGTLALLAMLVASKIEGKILVPAFTFPATIQAILFAGLSPKFVDIDPKTLNLSLEALEKVSYDNVGAILSVQSYGHDPEHFELIKFARQKNCRIFFDSAQSFGTKVNGKSIVGNGNGAMVSMHATKVFSSIEGGICVVDDETLHNEILNFRNFGFSDNQKTSLALGLNTKLSEVHAAYALSVIPKLQGAFERRKEIVMKYIKEFTSIENLNFAVNPTNQWNFSYAPFLLDSRESRESLFEFLNNHGIVTRKYFAPAVHQMNAFLEYSDTDEKLTNSERISSRILCLPLYSSMSEKDHNYIIEKTKSFFISYNR